MRIFTVRAPRFIEHNRQVCPYYLGKNVRNLFSFNGRSPELIIQDELHLISGPLGSLTGIYETALEYLCEKFGKSPKIIASTATIKNSKQQVRNLYNRETFQFPAPGINYDDSFFGVKASKDDRPLRTYIGLCEMGGSLSDLLIRVYAILFYIKPYLSSKEKTRMLLINTILPLDILML